MPKWLIATVVLLGGCAQMGSVGAGDAPDVEVSADTGAQLPDSAGDAPGSVPSLLTDRECPPQEAEASPTWGNFGEPFLLNHCNPCHSSQVPADQRQGAPVGIDFDTPEGIWSHYPRIYARAGDDNETMPPIATVPAWERELLGDWIACGMQGLPEP